MVRNARGRKASHHLTYELSLPDGRILRTRISHPPDKSDISRGLFAHVLADQLCVAEDEFWRCVKEGRLPDRGGAHQPGEPVPPEIVHLLINKVGLADDEVRKLGKIDAIARLQAYWTGVDPT